MDTTPDRLPVRADFGAADGPATPLSEAPAVALAFALGYAVASPQRANQFGPFCAMVEELGRRDNEEPFDTSVRPGQWDPAHLLGALLAVLPPKLAGQVTFLYQAHRGQRWAATGRRDGRGAT